MTDKELLERLRAEVAAVTPDCWSGILARVQSPAQQPEEAPVVPMPERKRRSAWRGWVAAAAVFFLVILGGGLYATQVPGGVATLDANPSIELTVNKLGRVLSARACNPDAQLVLDGLELRNQSLQTAADAIVANMQANGYVSADANSILVTVEAARAMRACAAVWRTLWKAPRWTAAWSRRSLRRCSRTILRWRRMPLPWASAPARQC